MAQIVKVQKLFTWRLLSLSTGDILGQAVLCGVVCPGSSGCLEQPWLPPTVPRVTDRYFYKHRSVFPGKQSCSCLEIQFKFNNLKYFCRIDIIKTWRERLGKTVCSVSTTAPYEILNSYWNNEPILHWILVDWKKIPGALLTSRGKGKQVGKKTNKQKKTALNQEYMWCVQDSIHTFVEKCMNKCLYLVQKEKFKRNQAYVGQCYWE